MESGKPYLLVAAIDFGTTYSGCALSNREDFKRDPTKAYVKQWVDPCSTITYSKTSTCVLFTKKREFSHFGFDAEYKYNELIEHDDYKEWYFFSRFKMFLYTLKSCDKDFGLEDETGKSMSALTVISASIRYLKESIFEVCKKQILDIKEDDIKWVITVPAIWSDPAKVFMRSAAVQAGIESEMLTIALEPEAAALFVKHVPVEKRVEGKEGDGIRTFSPGSQYIVVDAGGGTIDITAHEVQEDGRVKELIKANGGNWGGTRVDEKYMDFIKCLIGDAVTKKIEQNESSIFFETCREFEMAKRTIKIDSNLTFKVRIPPGLAKTYETYNPGAKLMSIKTVTMKTGNQIDVAFPGGKIKLASKDAEGFFSESISNITDHLSKLFKLEAAKGITTIILVGGYAESPVLINAIKCKFPHMRTIIPQGAMWSVLCGAVIFGHDQSLIKQRRSKYTYGIEVNELFDSSKHDENYKFNKNGEVWCGQLFSKLVEIDQLVTVGEYQKQRSYIFKEDKGELCVYSSTSANPNYVDEDGCSFIGHILPPGQEFLLKGDINVKMCFGETEIEFKAQQPKSQLTATYYLAQ